MEEKTKIEKADRTAVPSQKTVREDGRPGIAGGPKPPFLKEFNQWTVIDSFPAAGAEADIFLVEKDREKRILKLFRAGLMPKEEVVEKLVGLAGANPDKLVSIYEHGVDKKLGRYFELQEFFPYGTLKEFIAGDLTGHETVLKFVEEIQSIFAILHPVGILHLDIKPANILLRSISPFQCAVADFGIASLLGEGFSRKMTDVKGTSLYQSPESLSGVVGAKSDWWALGMIVLEMLSGKHPFGEMSRPEIFHHLSTKVVPIPAEQPGSWRKLLMGLLNRNPDLRWGNQEVDEWLGETRTSSVYSPPTGQQAGDMTAYTFLEVEYRDFSQLLSAFSSSNEHWNLGKQLIRRGEVARWLEENRMFDEAGQISRTLARGGAIDLVLFQVLLLFQPEKGLVWCGHGLDHDGIQLLLKRVIVGGQDEGDKLFLEYATNGWFQFPETFRFFELAASLGRSPLKTLPFSRRALVLFLLNSDEFVGASTDFTFQKIKEKELLFQVMSVKGFLPWAREEGIFTEEAMVIWGFLGECHSRGVGEPAIQLLLSLKGYEEVFAAKLASLPGFQDDWFKFLGGSLMSEKIFAFFQANRARLKWMEDDFLSRFRLKTQDEFDVFAEQYRVFLRILEREKVLRNFILPPVLDTAIRNGRNMAGSGIQLRRFLTESKIELLLEVIEHPELLVKFGCKGIKDWSGLEGFLKKEGVTIPTALTERTVFNLSNLAQEFFKLQDVQGTWAVLTDTDGVWALLGLCSALLALPMGLATFPAAILFFFVVLKHIWGRWRFVRGRKALINALQSEVFGNGHLVPGATPK